MLPLVASGCVDFSVDLATVTDVSKQREAQPRPNPTNVGKEAWLGRLTQRTSGVTAQSTRSGGNRDGRSGECVRPSLTRGRLRSPADPFGGPSQSAKTPPIGGVFIPSEEFT